MELAGASVACIGRHDHGDVVDIFAQRVSWVGTHTYVPGCTL